MQDSTTLLTAVLIAAYTALLLALARREDASMNGGAWRWLVLALLVGITGTVINLAPADAHTQTRFAELFPGDLTQPALSIILTNLLLVLFGSLTLHYLYYRRWTLPWLLIGLGWWLGQAVVSVTSGDPVVGQDGWLGEVYDPVIWPGVLALAGWVVLGTVLLLVAFYAFYKAHLPEVANRALVWAILVPLVVMGAVLGASGTSGLAEMGWIVQFAGLLGAAYSVSVERVFDTRRVLRHALATGILTLLSALIFFAVLAGARELSGDEASVYVLLGGLALLLALAYIPLRTLTQAFMDRLFGTTDRRTAQLLRQYSAEITGVVELDQLVDVTMHTLSRVLGVRRAGLITVDEDTAEALVVAPVARGLGEIPDIRGRILRGGPIYDRLAVQRAYLLQYDLDFGRGYAGAGADERAFFQQMRMSAYAPVVVQGQLIGLLCCGAKVSDDPFTEHDLELLMTVANQAGVALRNARLVADLRRREAEQAELNRALSATKEQLERLDGVKTDFITIASHELRTPLAQIRGYTDIMSAMNDDGMLDQDQVSGMTNSLRKASDRLEELIGAMLDVSQLDVNAMDLRFAQGSVENGMRMAIEPLTEAIRNRKLMLSARGLRNLPPILCDMPRLVQAFRNVVLNAIKFTPDGGQIEITGRLQDDTILITIRDTGIGIDPANHELIFEKFFRAHDPSLHSTGATKFMGAGPGLGLTIARGVIEGHGGRIWVESAGYDPQHFPGSTFYIQLPLIPPEGAKRVLPFEMAGAAAFGGSGA